MPLGIVINRIILQSFYLLGDFDVTTIHQTYQGIVWFDNAIVYLPLKAIWKS